MGAAKAIRLAPIARAAANRIVKRNHYSEKWVNNSQVHIGVFLDGILEGVLQFGPSLDKRKVIGLVRDTPWNGFIELNRMAFSERLPRNSESRALSIALRMMRKAYPHLQWVVSFADGAQCGDGTIYRAAGFVLTQIRPNKSIWQLGDVTYTDVGFRTGEGVRQRVCKASLTKGKHILADGSASMKGHIEAGAKPVEGNMLRYLYFFDPSARGRLTVPVLPFSEIERQGAGMYRGQRISRAKQGTG